MHAPSLTPSSAPPPSPQEAARRDHERKVAAMREWDEEELRLLDKAMKKWPQGVHKRWDQVTAYVRTRTQEEVLLMVKERQGASSTR
jgi:DnaJ family protein C protein 2